LLFDRTYEILLNGGTPFDTGVDLDPSISLKASSSRFQQIVRTNRQPRLTVKLLSHQKREIYDMLPDTLLTCHMYAQFISLYRQLLTEVVMDEGRDSQVAGNFWTVWCMRNNETSCSCVWLLSCSYHERNIGLNL